MAFCKIFIVTYVSIASRFESGYINYADMLITGCVSTVAITNERTPYES